MAELKVPAVSVAVVRGGTVAAARAWGSRDVAGTEPATTETLFMAGSVSKPVTATAALRLVAAGVLDLDEDVNARLKRWQVPPIGDWQPTVTLRHLLSHTAGLTVHGFPGYQRNAEVPDVVGVLEGKGNTPAVVVDTLPGMRWRYSGGGTTVVQLLIEDATGQSFAEVLDGHLLRPADMGRATFAQPPQQELHPLLAEGTAPDGAPVPGGWHVYPEQAAAGLWCTPTDLARWIVGVQGDLLTPELRAEMLREQAPGWGLGPSVSSAGEHPRFEHGGYDEGFLTALVAGQDDGTGVVVMVSSNAGGGLMTAVRDAVVDAEQWVPLPEPPAKDNASMLARYAGSWVMPDGRELTVAALPAGLALHLPGQQPLNLSPQSLSLWSTPVGLEVEFAPIGPDEPISSLTIRPARSFTARRQSTSAEETT